MKVKYNAPRKIGVSTTLVILGVLLGCLFILINRVDSEESKLTGKNIADDVEVPIKDHSTIDYNTLFKNNDYRLYNDDIISIFAVSNLGTTQLIYAYKSRPEGRQLTDRFFLHVFLKDDMKIDKEPDFVNCDFSAKPKKFDVEGIFYYVFETPLFKDDQRTPVLPESIRTLNTGRFKGVGRSEEYSWLKLKKTDLAKITNNFDRLSLVLKQKDYEKIKEKRRKALKASILMSEDDDLVKGTISLNGEAAKKMEMRLKGDWTDHLTSGNKWSYRCIMKNTLTVKGMRKFSIQHPMVRGFLWEWLFNKVIKEQGIMGLRYDYADVSLTVKGGLEDEHIPMGIMAIEESFDKILIENNRKREGVLISFDESGLWGNWVRQIQFHGGFWGDQMEYKNAQIKVFNEGKVLSDPKLALQFKVAKGLLEGLHQGKYTISEVFDVDLLATYVALTNLFGGYHGLRWHNIRLYYNPITNKLEPVSFDSNSGTVIDRIHGYPDPAFETDSVFEEKLLEKLHLVSSSEFIDRFMNRHGAELDRLSLNFALEFEESFDPSILVKNRDFIKKALNPSELPPLN